MEETNVTLSSMTSLDPVSAKLARTFLTVILVFVCGSVSFFGIFANTINIVVFVRQRFKDSINISLLGLAVADLMCGLATFWMCICCSPYFVQMGLPFNGIDVMYMTAPCVRVCSNRITSVINTFIAFERCLCIVIPLKVKILLSPLRTKVIITSFFVFMFILFSPFYYVHKLEWRYSLHFNRSLLTLVFTDNREIVNSVTFMIHSVILSVICLFSIVLCTIILVVKLNKKAKWRHQSTSQSSSKGDTPSSKEQQVVKMVTLISTIFIICYLPATVIFIAMSFYPQFSVTGKFSNLYYVIWITTICLENINSSVNIIVYLNMSSKYRNTFLEMFRCKMKQNN